MTTPADHNHCTTYSRENTAMYACKLSPASLATEEEKYILAAFFTYRQHVCVTIDYRFTPGWALLHFLLILVCLSLEGGQSSDIGCVTRCMWFLCAICLICKGISGSNFVRLLRQLLANSTLHMLSTACAHAVYSMCNVEFASNCSAVSLHMRYSSVHVQYTQDMCAL